MEMKLVIACAALTLAACSLDTNDTSQEPQAPVPEEQTSQKAPPPPAKVDAPKLDSQGIGTSPGGPRNGCCPPDAPGCSCR